MKLSDQVVSLEIAKKLKSLGVKQESFFYWKKIGDEFALSNIGSNIWLKPDDIFGESLQYESGEEYNQFGSTEVEARGKMLIYLIENKIIEV